MMSLKTVGRGLASAVVGVALCGFIAKADAPATATWTGGGDHSVLTDPLNWSCKDADGAVIGDAVPDAATTVITVTGDTSFNCPAGTMPIWKAITVSGTITLTADCDWRGLGTLDALIAAGATIDLRGHKLFVSVPSATFSTALMFTDTTTDDAAPGELHLTVASGTFTNSGIVLADNLRLVKEGAGTFVPAKYKQTYTGGNEIVEGTLMFYNPDPGDNAKYPLWNDNYCRLIGAEGKTVVIKEGGTLEVNGLYDLDRYRYELAGGRITNNKGQAHTNYSSLGNVTLTADSTIVPTQSLCTRGVFNLGGHELEVAIGVGKYYYVRDSVYSNGTLRVSSGGTLQFEPSITARDLNLDVKAAMNVGTAVDLNDYTFRGLSGEWNVGSVALRVHGAFTPVTEYYYGCEMQNGSTINLSEKTGAWSTAGAAQKGRKGVTFAAGAAITIDVGARVIQPNEKVVAWSAIPSGVSFRIVGTAITHNLSPRIENDGIYYDLGDAGVAALAHWTGAGRHGDFADPANWVCTNGLGQALLNNAVPGPEAVVYFHDNLDFDVTDAAMFATFKVVHLDPSFTLARDCDWSGLTVNEPCLSGTTINLSGHAFKLMGVNGVSALAFTVTDDVAPGGAFTIDVPADATFENTLITPAGTVRLVKDGQGLFIPHRYGLAYTGGTHIAAGALRLFRGGAGDVFSPNKTGYPTPLGAKTSVVTVDSGASYDINGLYDTCIYPIVLNGGTLKNSTKQTEYTWGGLGSITLLQDSTLDCSFSTVFANGDSWTLNGHTLFVQFANGAHLYRKSISAANGTIVTTGDGVFDVHSDTFNAPDVTLDCASELCVNALVVVSNYVSRYTGSANDSHLRIEVAGAFKPMTDSFNPVTLREGAVIDLSDRTNVFNIVGQNGGTVAYATGTANIAIDVGARELAAGEQLVRWNAKPANIAFTLRGANVQPNKLSVCENGIFYNLGQNPRVVLTAIWTGRVGDGDLANSGNWTCQNVAGEVVENALPQECSFVTFTGAVGIDIPIGTTVPWQKVKVESVALTQDCDWRGLGTLDAFIVAGATIDLRGHKLFVSAPNATLSTMFTFTDSTTDAVAPGELHLAVASGTFTNSGIVLAGNLRLVKEGAGTYVPAKYKQTYTGGNEIVEGTLMFYNPDPGDNAKYPLWNDNYCRPIGAEGKTVVIKENGTLEMNGLYDTDRFKYELAGGRITNNKGQAHTNYSALGNITLITNSAIVVNQSLCTRGVFNLGGHEMEVACGLGNYYYVRDGVYSNGTLRVSSGGTLQFEPSITARDLNLDVNAAMNVGTSVDLNDYTYRYGVGNSHAGSGTLRVHGTFTPVTECFYGCEMQDGSTLNLTGKTDVWDTAGTATTGKKGVTFAAGARITVALGERDDFVFEELDENRMAKVMTWTTPPDATTRFVLDAVSAKSGCSFVKRNDGLYLAKPLMVILFR